MNLVKFENSYLETEESFILDEGEAFAAISIDGYPANEDEDGEVVAKVWCTKHGDIIIDWHDNGYRLNAEVIELINKSKETLRNLYIERD